MEINGDIILASIAIILSAFSITISTTIQKKYDRMYSRGLWEEYKAGKIDYSKYTSLIKMMNLEKYQRGEND